MSNKLSIASIILMLALAPALSGCGGIRPSLVESSIEKCPPKIPTLDRQDCPATFPKKGEHLDSLLKAWEDATLYSLCKDELINLWERAWESCPNK